MSRPYASNFAIIKSCGKQSQALDKSIKIVSTIPGESVSAVSEEAWKVHAVLSELYENHKVTYLEMSPHIHKVDHT